MDAADPSGFGRSQEGVCPGCGFRGRLFFSGSWKCDACIRGALTDNGPSVTELRKINALYWLKEAQLAEQSDANLVVEMSWPQRLTRMLRRRLSNQAHRF